MPDFFLHVLLLAIGIALTFACMMAAGEVNKYWYLPLLQEWLQDNAFQLLQADYKMLYRNAQGAWRLQTRYSPVFVVTVRRIDGIVLRGFVQFKLRKFSLFGRGKLANYQVTVNWLQGTSDYLP